MRAAPRWILVISLLGASLLGVGSAQAAELDAAAVKARATLPTFMATWKKQPAGLSGYRVLVSLKAGGQTEAVWLEDFALKGQTLSAVLKSAPRVLKGLSAGQTVPFTEADIIDWGYEDGSTSKLMGHYHQCAEIRELPEAEYQEQLEYLGLACKN